MLVAHTRVDQCQYWQLTSAPFIIACPLPCPAPSPAGLTEYDGRCSFFGELCASEPLRNQPHRCLLLATLHHGPPLRIPCTSAHLLFRPRISDLPSPLFPCLPPHRGQHCSARGTRGECCAPTTLAMTRTCMSVRSPCAHLSPSSCLCKVPAFPAHTLTLLCAAALHFAVVHCGGPGCLFLHRLLHPLPHLPQVFR